MLLWVRLYSDIDDQPRRDSNPQSSDSKSDALYIRARGPCTETLYYFFQKGSGLKGPSGFIDLCSGQYP